MQWTTAAEEAFENCKKALSDATALDYHDPDAPLALMVDASDVGVGAALQQARDGEWKPLGFYSKTGSCWPSTSG